MVDFKQEIANSIAKVIELEATELRNYIEVPKDSNMGDYAFPCFRLAKELRKAPPMIASEIKEKIELNNEYIEKVEVAGGYLNFFINNEKLVKEVLEEINSKKEEYGKVNIGEGKNVVVDFSSPNIAKPFHIGHLRTTVIGQALYNIYNFIGYNSVGINHLGDYGTQFGKLIEGYKLWGDEYDIDSNPIDELMKIYVRINALCKEDEEVLERCRDNFKKLEEGDKYCYDLWERFREVSLKEFQKVYDLLGTKFDSWNGEAFYIDKMGEVIEKLEATGKLVESEGARIIDLEDKGMPPCIICKSNGASIYATRDLAAILYRARTYDFAKAIYVTAYEQNLHFKQIFEVAKLLGIDEEKTNNLIHVPYGMVRLTTGKMSTREGNVIKVDDLLNETIEKVKEIIKEKNADLENKDEIAKRIGIGAVVFNNLATTLIKDVVFDWNTMLNFTGETGPYVQYIYVRTKSILEKANYIPNIEEVDFSILNNKEALETLKLLYSFSETVVATANKNETSILTRYLIDLAQSFSRFYDSNKIITDDKKTTDARLLLTQSVGNVLKTGMNLLGIQMPDRM